MAKARPEILAKQQTKKCQLFDSNGARGGSQFWAPSVVKMPRENGYLTLTQRTLTQLNYAQLLRCGQRLTLAQLGESQLNCAKLLGDGPRLNLTQLAPTQLPGANLVGWSPRLTLTQLGQTQQNWANLLG